MRLKILDNVIGISDSIICRKNHFRKTTCRASWQQAAVRLRSEFMVSSLLYCVALLSCNKTKEIKENKTTNVRITILSRLSVMLFSQQGLQNSRHEILSLDSEISSFPVFQTDTSGQHFFNPVTSILCNPILSKKRTFSTLTAYCSFSHFAARTRCEANLLLSRILLTQHVVKKTLRNCKRFVVFKHNQAGSTEGQH